MGSDTPLTCELIPSNADPKALENARNKEKTFLELNKDKLRSLISTLTPEYKEAKILKWVFFNNAMSRFDFDKDTFAILATQTDKAHDEALGIKFRGYTENGAVSEKVKGLCDFFEHIEDSVLTEFFADDESFTNDNLAQFFKIQIEIAEAQISKLKTLDNKEAADKQIKQLEKTIRAFKEIVTKATNADTFAKLEVLKNEIST